MLLLGSTTLIWGARPELRVGIAREAELPMAGLQNGVLSGLAIDLSRQLAEQLGMELTLSRLPQRDLIAALKGGRIDLVLTTQPEPGDELRALRLLTSTPLMHTGQLALVRREDIEEFSRPLDVLLMTGRAGFERGTTAAQVVHQRMPSAQRMPFGTARDALRALQTGEIDLLVLDAPRAWNVLANPQDAALVALLDPLLDEHLVWAVRDSDLHVLARINAILARWREDATLVRLIRRWIPVRVQARRTQN